MPSKNTRILRSGVFRDLSKNETLRLFGAITVPSLPFSIRYSTGHRKSPSPVTIQTEDVALITLRFRGGAHGAVAISQVSPGRKNSLQYEIDGSSAAVAWESETPDRLWIGHRDRPNELLSRDPGLLNPMGRAAARLPGGHVEGFADTFAAHFISIYEDVIAGRPAGRPAYPTFEDGHVEMLVGDAVAESARTGRWVDVAMTPTPKVP